MTSVTPRRLIVGITGATGIIYGVRLLERLREAGVETHLVISRWGARTLLARDAVLARTGRSAGHRVLRAGRHGRGDLERVVRDDGMIVAAVQRKTLARSRTDSATT